METTTWRRAKQIFHEALDKTRPERSGFVEAACHEDRDLRAQVQALLAAHDEAGEFLASPTEPEMDESTRAVATLTATQPEERAGARIGSYKLLQVIGEGGFGVVYMAEQEEPVRRQVALKIIKLGMDTKQVIARFEAERQALALMEHPNIARVLDAGATETGRPYFVMELVRGVSITEHCDANTLSARERLDLFTEVCGAVQHAHQKGIIHRDIKPSNVLVTLHDGKPVPKVIDFGIAKAVHQRLTEKTLFTEYGQFIGTPAYMSPERAEMSGLDVDTRSDIYSLGVLLYELLTGTTPFDVKALRQAGYGEIQRIIREEEPPTPSTRLSTLGDAITDIAKHRRTEPAALTRLVRGDLDWIVMKALEKSRTRRYDSASELAGDVTRHLRHEPVVARPPSALYKLKKFVRRHRVPVAAAVAIGATIIVLGSLTLWQARIAQRRAHQIWINSVLAHATAAEDPLVKAQLVLELADLPDNPERLSLAREAADHPMPVAIFRGQLGGSFSPDGTRFLTTTESGTLWIRSTDGSGEPIELRGHNEWPSEVAFSPDGTRVLTAAGEGPARLWRSDGMEESIVLREEEDIIDVVDFSPDGRRFVTGSRGGTVRLWRTDETESSIIVGRHDESAMAVVFGPDGTRLLVCYRDDPPRIWRADGSGEHIVLPHSVRKPDLSHRVHSGAFSPDGNSVVTGSFDGMVRVWRADGSAEPLILRLEKLVSGVDFSPDGTRIVAATIDGTAWIWPADGSGEPIALRGHGDWLSAAAFSPDGARILTASKDGTARLWHADDPEQSVLLASSPAWIWGAGFSPDGTRVVTTTQDEVRVWRADATGEGVVFGTDAGGVASLNADGTRLVTGSRDGTVRVRRADGTGEPLLLGSHGGPVHTVQFSPDGTRVVSGSEDRTATIWRIDGSEDPIVLRGHTQGCGAAFTPDGSRVVTAGGDGFVKLWSSGGVGEPIVLAREERSPLLPASGFTPDGSKVIVLTGEDEVQLVSLDGTGEPTTLVQHKGLFSAAFSPDGTRLATSSWSDNTAKVWRVDGAGEPIVLSGHTAGVFGAVFSPDGTLVATGSLDGTARVWRADGTGEPLVLGGHGAMVGSAGFTHDGTRLLTVGDGPPRLRRVTWPALLEYLREHTRVCLTPEERIKYLVETPDEAATTYAKCERRQRRAPIL